MKDPKSGVRGHFSAQLLSCCILFLVFCCILLLLRWKMSLQNLLCHFPLFMESVMESGAGLPSKDKEFFVDFKSL